MSKNRGVLLGITALGAGAGYYLYRAGGDPELAKKGAEKDLNKVASEVKQQLPGSAEQAKKEAEEKSRQAGSSIEKALDQAKSKAEEARKETGNALSKGVDKFDQTVGEGASKAKSGISSWFGGK